MTYDQILTLDKIIQYGSFKAASQHLFKSQPSLSMAIKKLEEEFEIKIFDRSGYRPTLTEDGMSFYKKAIPALEKFNELALFAKELGHGIESEISISIDAICPLGEISKIFKHFMQPHITTSLNLNVDILDELHNKLISKEIDFAIGTSMGAQPSIEHIPILKTEMLPVISTQFYQKTDGSIESLKLYPQIIVKSSPKADTTKIFGEVKGMKQWFTTDISTKERLIINELGWGWLPSHQIKNHLESGSLSIIQSIPKIKAVSIDIFLLKNDQKVMGPNTKKLWDNLTRLSN